MRVNDAQTPARPVPFDFDDFRAYLRAMIAFLKATQPQFSYRYFSRKAGYSSPNFLKLVADGKRNLSQDSIVRFAKALGLGVLEREAFENLVLLGQARSDEQRNRYYRRIKRRSTSDAGAQMQLDQYEVYSLWYALPIKEMLLLSDFREDEEWIGRRLNPAISGAKVRKALDLLLRVGLVERDESGALRPADVKLSTPATVPTIAVRNYHRAMLNIAAGSLDKVPVDRRNVTSLTLNLTRAQYLEVCERIEKLRAEILDAVEDAPRDDAVTETYSVGFQAVPLTRKVDE